MKTPNLSVLFALVTAFVVPLVAGCENRAGGSGFNGTGWANWAAANSAPENLNFANGTAGWFQPPASHASATVDPKGGPHGEPCLVLTSGSGGTEQWASLQQLIGPGIFLGKRVRLSALLKADGVTEGADLSMRVASPEGSPYAQAQVLRGTTAWVRCSVVLDMPSDSPGLDIGVDVAGAGSLRVADVRLEPVGKDVPLSASPDTIQGSGEAKLQGKSGVNWAAANSSPQNLGFTSNLDGWFQPPASQASASVDPKGGPHGEPCLVLIPSKFGNTQWASLQQAFLVGPFRGHRVRLTAMVKAEGIKQAATMAMGADSPEANHFARAPMITGTTSWQPRSVVVEAPADAIGIGLDFSVWGAGTLRVADLRLQPVGKDVPVTPEIGR